MSGRSGFSSRAWLHMLREGGRWSVAELSQALQLSDEAAHSAPAALQAMADTGSCRRYEKTPDPTSRVRFGVTGECSVPRGVKLSEIMACNLAEVQE